MKFTKFLAAPILAGVATITNVGTAQAAACVATGPTGAYAMHSMMGICLAPPGGWVWHAPPMEMGVGPFSVATGLNLAGQTMTFGTGGFAGPGRADTPDFTDPSTGAGTVTVSTQSRGAEMPLRIWADTRFSTSSDDRGRESDVTSLRFGADVAVSPNWTLGLAIGAGRVDGFQPGPPVTSLEGDIAFVQPYAIYERGPWRASLSALFGRGDYDFNLGFAGSFDTEFSIFALNIARDIELANGATLTPSFRHIIGREEETSAVPVFQPGTAEYSQTSLGALYAMTTSGSTTFQIGLYADFMDANTMFTAAGGPTTTEWSGRAVLGAEFALNDRSDLSVQVERGGIGGSLQSVTGSVMWKMRF